MPSVGKMSRAIFCSASPAPSTIPSTSTMIVIGRRNDEATRFMLTHELPIQLFQSLADQGQHLPALRGEPIVHPCSRTGSRNLAAFEPPISLHPVQQRVQRSRADLVAMPAQLIKHPLTMNRSLARVVQDVHLPKAQQDLTARAGHLPLGITIFDVDYHNAQYCRRQIGRGSAAFRPQERPM